MQSYSGSDLDSRELARQHLICRAAMRTTKLLVGLAKGVDVLSVEWLEKCAELKRMIGQYSAVCCVQCKLKFSPPTDPSPFVLKDAVNEEKLDFNLAASIARSKKLHDEQGGLFANKLFHIVCPF